ncbi:hypothetical protein [Streptomyces sp. NPDC020917]|uniref:hypothetical protein n=1 Tax=Streptomyces sp. NPDC020917 TaxID=3365102 RepID=UPI0037B05C01
MRATRRAKLAALAAAGVLSAAGLGLTAASPAQAATCDSVPSGYICLHIHHNTTDTWTWSGPWYACAEHYYGSTDNITWVSDNQYSGTMTWFYDVNHNYLGSVTAPFSGRPPGYMGDSGGRAYYVQTC